MKTRPFHLEVAVLVLLTLVRWPDPSQTSLNCPWGKSRLVRKIILKKLVPILERYRTSFPQECPFHASRDVYGPDGRAPGTNVPMWSCKVCGETFTTERQLVAHMDHNHFATTSTFTLLHEGAVCLADYCSIMRCQILLRDSDQDTEQDEVLPVPFSGDRGDRMGPRSSTTPAGDHQVAVVVTKEPSNQPITVTSSGPPAPTQAPVDIEVDVDIEEQQEQAPSDPEPTSSAPVQSKDGAATNRTASRVCNEEELKVLHKQCQAIIRSCIMDLLVNLSSKDFQEIEEDMDRAICSYLTCEKFWEDPLGEEQHFSLGFLLALVGMLTAGTFLCYYIVWVVFDPGDAIARSDCYEVYVLYSEQHLVNAKSGHKYQIRRKVVQKQ